MQLKAILHLIPIRTYCRRYLVFAGEEIKAHKHVNLLMVTQWVNGRTEIQIQDSLTSTFLSLTIGHCLQAHTELLGLGTWIDSDLQTILRSPLVLAGETFTHSWHFSSSPQVEASQVLYVQPSELHAFARNISAQISSVPGFPALLNRSPVLAASSNCTECPKASVCFFASLTNSHAIVELLCALLQEACRGIFCTTIPGGNAFQFLPTFTSRNFLFISNPEISWIHFSPIPPLATLLREWKLLTFIPPSSFVQLKISAASPLLH